MSATVPPAANDPAPPQLVAPGKSVSAGAGVSWVSEGWHLFARTPLMWIVLFVLVFIIAIVSGFIPVLGSLAFQVLTPVFAGGFVLGCWSLENNGDLEIEHLFAGFKRNFGALATVGALYLGGFVVIFLVFAMIVGFSIIPVLMTGGDASAAFAGLAAMGGTLVVGSLIVMALGALLLSAYWFAPALVVMHGMGAVAAMKASFFATFRNFLAFLVYGIVMFLLLIVAVIPFGLGLLVWVPLAITSTYRAYRQIFTE
jgi:uncharacterized membrane protein